MNYLTQTLKQRFYSHSFQRELTTGPYRFKKIA